MADQEKVLKALECCKTIHPDCEQCPYFDTDAERIGRALCKAAGRPDDDLALFCTACLHTDALELLKEQEPRVMTLAQMQSLEDFTPIWFEYSAGNETTFEPAFLRWETNRFHLLHDTKSPEFDDRTYLKDWRCWTSRPTEEQRKAAKWDG